MKTELQQRRLWDRLTGRTAPVTRSQPRQVSLKALPDIDTPLVLQGATQRYSFHSIMERGAEYTYLRLVRYEQRGDPMAQPSVAPIHLIFYAE